MPLLDPSEVSIKGLRAAVHSNNGNIEPTAETTAMVQAVASALEGAGVEVEESVPEALKQATRLYESIEYADGGVWIQRMLDAAGTTKVSEEIGRRQGTVEPVSSARLMELLEELDAYRSDMLAYMQSYDIIVCPTAAFPATLHGTWKLGGINREYSHTSAYNLTGWPGWRGPGGHFTRGTAYQRADRGPTLEGRRGPGSARACRGAIRWVGDAVGVGVGV